MKSLLRAMWEIFYIDILNPLTFYLPEEYYRQKWIEQINKTKPIGEPTLWSEKLLNNFKQT